MRAGHALDHEIFDDTVCVQYGEQLNAHTVRIPIARAEHVLERLLRRKFIASTND